MKHKITQFTLLLLDILIVVFAFLFVTKIRSGTMRILALYGRSLIPFTLIWIITSVIGGKYSFKNLRSGFEYVRRLFLCNISAVAIILGLIFFGKFHYSRYLVFSTILGVSVIELCLFTGIYYALRFNRENASYASTRLFTRSDALEEQQRPRYLLKADKQVPILSTGAYVPPFSIDTEEDAVLVPLWRKYLQDNESLFDFINDYVDLTRFKASKTYVLNSEIYYNIQNEPENSRQIFINLHRVNDIRRLNLYFIRVNEMLMPGGVFICRGQTIAERRNHFYRRYTPHLGVFFYGMDFVIRRVFPKLPILQGWYFALTKGRNRALSETEMLGRFYYCGFELIHKREIGGLMHFILKKVQEPSTNPNPTYGPLIRLKRIGKGGKVIYVKKLRTMHPYSEYLQEYVFQTNSLQEGGKFKDDFRITSWGAILRTLWIDELPQFINFFRGEVSLVGVRALSEHYFNLYPKDLQELRKEVKPGLVPPFYADMPKTMEEIVESERRYIQSKLQKPFSTDWRYFWKAFWNILFRHARSK